MGFEPITSQAQFDGRLRERLRRQCDHHRVEFNAYRAEQTAKLEDLKREFETLRQQAARVNDLVSQFEALRRQLLDAEARVIAGELGFINPSSAVVASGVLEGLEVGPDGEVDRDLIRDRLTAFGGTHAYFLQPNRGVHAS